MKPDRAVLFDAASSQDGYLIRDQAAEAGYAKPLLDHDLHAERFVRAHPGLRVHFADVAAGEQAWVGAAPATTPVRTLRDCTAFHVAPDLAAQAVRDGTRRMPTASARRWHASAPRWYGMNQPTAPPPKRVSRSSIFQDWSLNFGKSRNPRKAPAA